MSTPDIAASAGGHVELIVDGVTYRVPEGVTVAVALRLARPRSAASTQPTGSRWSVFCGMGSCYECVAVIDGVSGVRTCITPVRNEMRVETEGMRRSA